MTVKSLHIETRKKEADACCPQVESSYETGNYMLSQQTPRNVSGILGPPLGWISEGVLSGLLNPVPTPVEGNAVYLVIILVTI